MAFECIFQTPNITPEIAEAKMEDFNLFSVCCFISQVLDLKKKKKVKFAQIQESLTIYKQDGSTTACCNRTQTIDHMAFWLY